MSQPDPIGAVVRDECRRRGVKATVRRRDNVVDVFLDKAEDLNKLPATVAGVTVFPRLATQGRKVS